MWSVLERASPGASVPLPAAPHMACPEASEGQGECLLLFLSCLHVLFAVSALSL